MTCGEPAVAAQRARPARAGDRARAGVIADARDDHVRVAAVGIDRHPAALAAAAVRGQRAGRLGPAQQARAVERKADRTGAVIAGGAPAPVAAAPDVPRMRDAVRRADEPAHARRRSARYERPAVTAQAQAPD